MTSPSQAKLLLVCGASRQVIVNLVDVFRSGYHYFFPAPELALERILPMENCNRVERLQSVDAVVFQNA